MSDVQKIVKALELAINHATTQQTLHVGIFKKDTIDVINGDILRAGVESIINIYKEEPKYISPDAIAEQLAKC